MTNHKSIQKALILLAVASSGALPALAADSSASGTLDQVPVKALTIYNSSISAISQKGRLPLSKDGSMTLYYHPRAMLGTFRASATDSGRQLASIISSSEKRTITRPALNMAELLKANKGKSARLEVLDSASSEKKKFTLEGTLIGPMEYTVAQQMKNSPEARESDLSTTETNLFFLKTAEGTTPVDVNKIISAEIIGEMNRNLETTEVSNKLRFKLRSRGKGDSGTAGIQMAYLSPGFSWQPQYAIELDGKSTANIALSATITNNLTDLKDTHTRVAIGQPYFRYRTETDPLFNTRVEGPRGRNMFQVEPTVIDERHYTSGRSERHAAPASPPNFEGTKREDLFFFDLGPISLEKGQRMNLQVASFSVPYKDLYTVTIPSVPPHEADAFRSQGSPPVPEESKRPNVWHQIRLSNKSKYPIAQAPALLTTGGDVLAQSMVYSAAVGDQVDVSLGMAPEVLVERSEESTSHRSATSLKFKSDQLVKVSLGGKITVSNLSEKAINIQVRRDVVGQVNEAQPKATATIVDAIGTAREYPYWWQSYNWPEWWHKLNGVSRITWNLELQPGEKKVLSYNWSYYAK